MPEIAEFRHHSTAKYKLLSLKSASCIDRLQVQPRLFLKLLKY